MPEENDATYRRGLRETFTETIRQFLRDQGRADTEQIYQHVKATHPDLCDDDIQCCCEGIPRPEPEWKHQVRLAQQDLRDYGEAVELDREVWSYRHFP